MAHKMDLHDSLWTKFEASDLDVGIDDPDLISLRKVITELHRVIPVDEIAFHYTSLPIVVNITFVDGRTWQETHHDLTTDPHVSFAVTGSFKMSEILTLRPLRALLNTLIGRGLTKLTVRPALVVP